MEAIQIPDIRSLRKTSRVNPLAVVIVTYNSAEVLPGLLSSLQEGLAGVASHEVIVADNASSDDSAAIARSHPIGARVIETGRNGGYSAGINAAVAVARADADILVLNPDIRLSPGVAARLRARLQAPWIGIVVPAILEEDGSRSWSLRREPSLVTAWAEALLGGTLARRLNLSETLDDEALYEKGGLVDWATGAILLISAETRRRIGAWDESFFLYSEEVDYMRRARAAGFFVEHEPAARVTHIGGETRASPFLFSLSAKNRLRDYARRHGALATLAFRLGLSAGELLRCWRGPEHRAALAALMTFRSGVDARPLRRSARPAGPQARNGAGDSGFRA